MQDAPKEAIEELLGQMWQWPALPAVFLYAICNSYNALESIQEERQELKLLRAVLYLLAIQAKSPQAAAEMLQMKLPAYLLPVLKSRNAPEDLTVLALTYFLALANNSDCAFFVKNEAVGLVILELASVKANHVQFAVMLLQILVEKQPTYFADPKRQKSLIEALKKFMELAQPHSQRSHIQRSLQAATAILERLDKSEQ